MSTASSKSDRQTIAIVGGGAAGMMAAYFAKLKHLQARVILIEKNTYLGAKVLVSGGGRCNVTTGVLDVKEILKNYPRGAKFLTTAMHNFPPEAVMSWFTTHGADLKIEEDLRVFPTSNNGKDIMGALQYALNNLSVEILLNQQMTKLENAPQKPSTNSDHPKKFILNFKNHPPIIADQVILTTGGNAYRHTGSTGDGYAFARAMGHTITTLAPSLASLHTAEKWAHQLSGLSFPKAFITLTGTATNQQQYERTGPFLFTHQGVSGPAIFAISSAAAYEAFSNNNPAKLSIDFFINDRPEILEQIIKNLAQEHPRKNITNLLATLLPKSLAEAIIQEKLQPQFPEINWTNLTAAHLSKPLRQSIVQQLKGLELHVVGRGAGDEFVTAGGVPLDEVNQLTMESRLRRGLFFAGELLDIDGFTGGFNLQASWATGALAGESV